MYLLYKHSTPLIIPHYRLYLPQTHTMIVTQILIHMQEHLNIHPSSSQIANTILKSNCKAVKKRLMYSIVLVLDFICPDFLFMWCISTFSFNFVFTLIEFYRLQLYVDVEFNLSGFLYAELFLEFQTSFSTHDVCKKYRC